MTGYESIVGGSTGWLSESDENLNGTEICKIFLPNTSGNRTIVNSDCPATLRWTTGGSTLLFSGTCTGANHAADVLETSIIPSVYYKMAFKGITENYVATAASTILTAIGLAAGVVVSWTAPTDPVISVRFARASCFDAGKFLADIANTDYYYVEATNTFVVGLRGSYKGALTIIQDIETSRMKNRVGKVNIVYVRGQNAAGAYLEGFYNDGLGTKIRSFTEKKAADVTTLNLLALKYYNEMNVEDGPSQLEVSLNDSGVISLGDTVALTVPALGLTGTTERITRIVRRLDQVFISINAPNKTLEDRVIDLTKYEEFGIYITSAIPKGSQGWNSDIVFSVDVIDPVYTVNVNGATPPADGNINFADGDTLVIDLTPQQTITVSVGTSYVYWLWPVATLTYSQLYSDCVGNVKGLLAKITCDGVNSLTIETFQGKGTTLGEGQLYGTTLAAPAGFDASDITTTSAIAADGTVSITFDVKIARVTGATQYALRVRIDGTTNWTTLFMDDPGSGTDIYFVIPRCMPGLVYKFQAVAISKLNKYSPWTTIVDKLAATDTTPPGVPTGLGATGIPGGVIVRWTVNTEADLAGYLVYRNTTNSIPADPIAVINTNFFAWVVETTSDYVPQYFWVKAFDTSKNISAATSSVVATPLKLSAIDLNVELRPWTSDLYVTYDSATPSNNKFYWGKGGAITDNAKVTFSDGSSKTIDALLYASRITLAAGVWYCYWDASTTLRQTTDHAAATGPGLGMIAIVKVETDSSKPPTILMFDSYLPTISGGVITVKSIIVDHLEATMTITGHLIQTSVGYPKIIMSDTLGIVGMKDASTITFKLDPTTGEAYVADGHIMINEAGIKGYSGAAGTGTLQFSLDAATGKATAGGGNVILDSNGVTVKGIGQYGIQKADGTPIGWIDGTEEGGRGTLKIMTVLGTQDITLESGGYSLKFRGDGDIDVFATLDLSDVDAHLILPLKTGDPSTPRTGELWFRTDL